MIIGNSDIKGGGGANEDFSAPHYNNAYWFINEIH